MRYLGSLPTYFLSPLGYIFLPGDSKDKNCCKIGDKSFRTERDSEDKFLKTLDSGISKLLKRDSPLF